MLTDRESARFCSISTKIGTIQKRLTWPGKEANDRMLEMHIKLQGTWKNVAIVHAGPAGWG